MNNNYVKIFDTTLRDGEQSPGNSMNLAEKLRMARQLERLKVDVIEAGFPIASPDDFAAVQQIAQICEHAEVCGLARSLEKDITAAWEAVQKAKKPRIHTFVATSPVHMEHKLRKTPDEVLEMAIHAVSFAKNLCSRVDFSPEDAFRSERPFLYKVIAAAIDAGADTINIPDTVGYATPSEFGKLISDIIENVHNSDGIIFSTHCHNDLGLATANSLAGVEGGARQIECTINGIGERAGNAALEEVVMTMRTRHDHYKDLETGVDIAEIYPSSRLLTSITGVAVQPNKAIVGANAFAHESGIHQDGVLKERTTYEIMRAEDIGKESNALVLGKHSGRAALKDRLEKLGYEVTKEEVTEFYGKFIKLADQKKEIFDEDIVLLMEGADEEAAWELVDTHVVASTKQASTAEVTLRDRDGKEHTVTGTGAGPVDAAYSAVDQIVALKNTLLEYSVNAVTEGIDAQATVAVQLRIGDRMISGSAGSNDIVHASVAAYVSALNRSILLQ